MPQETPNRFPVMAASLKKAWRAYNSGESQRAATLFSELCHNECKSSHPFTQRGLFLLKTERYDEACESFNQAIEREKDNPAPLFFLALAQTFAGQAESSAASLKELSILSPHHQGRSTLELLIELREGDPLERLAQFGFGAESSKSKPGTPFQRLAASLGRGDPSWLPSDLSSSEYLLGPILVEMETKLHPLEVPSLEHHQPLLPEDLDEIEPHRRTFFEELLQIRSSIHAGSAMRKGRRYLEKGFSTSSPVEQRRLLNKALIYLRLARRRDPFTFRVFYHLAECYIFLSKKENGQPFNRFYLQQAESALIESAKREGVNPYLLFYLAYTQHLLGRPRLAIEYYQAATKKFEKLPEAHYGQAQCYLLLGDRARAQELLLKAVNSDLTLARERLQTFATLLSEHGTEYFDRPFPTLPPEPETLIEPEAVIEPGEAIAPEPATESDPPVDSSDDPPAESETI